MSGDTENFHRIFHALRAAPGGELLSDFPHEYTSEEIANLAVDCIEAMSETVRKSSLSQPPKD